MKHTHQLRLNWTQQEVFEGVTQVWTADGSMFTLEAQEQDDETVVGTIWRRIPATFWEPEDVECIHEGTYDTVDDAKQALEKIDEDEHRAEQENEARLEQSMLEA